MPPLQSAVCPTHGTIVIPNNSPLESLVTFALIFLIGALWGHLRCANRGPDHKGQAA
ncbi:hypothetical protein LMG9673_01857 [Ralstonia pseudosolanacearum]|nr:hypothetical protein LMG9673_01857 [Ralstonia pseudosolanacearum]